MDLYDKYAQAIDAEDALKVKTQEEMADRYAAELEDGYGDVALPSGPAYDGDTAYVEGQGRRFTGVDTTELKLGDGSAAPLSIEARNRTNELIASGKFKYYSSGEEDRYGRDLGAYKDANGNSIQQALLREGLAFPTSFQNQELSNLQAYAEGTRRNAGNASEQYGTVINTRAKEMDKRSYGKRAWARGTDLMQMNLHQFGELMGEVTGVDAIKEWGEEGVIRNMAEAAMSPAEIESTDDIESLSDLGKYIIERGIENAPNFLTDLGVAAGAAAATALTGGVAAPILYAAIGKQFVGKLGWKAAGKFGMGASMYAQMAGESRHTQLAAGVDNPLLALGTGAVNTGLEYYGLQSILKGFMPKGKITNAAGLAKHIGKQAAINTGIEGSTEWLQGLTNQLAIKMAKPEHEIDWHELTESFFAGMAAGGSTATVSATAGGGAAYLLEKGRNQATPEGTPTPSDHATMNTNTVPETPAALQAQLNEAATPGVQKNTVLAPQGREQFAELDLPAGMVITDGPDGSAMAAPAEAAAKSKLHQEQGMAAATQLAGYEKSKEEIIASGERSYVITRRDAEGNEMFSEQATESDTLKVRTKVEAQQREGDVVEVSPLEESSVVADRQSAMQEARQAGTAPTGSMQDATVTQLPQPQGESPAPAAPHETAQVAKEERGKGSLYEPAEAGQPQVLKSPAAIIQGVASGSIAIADVFNALAKVGADPTKDVKSKRAVISRRGTIRKLLQAGIRPSEFIEKQGGHRGQMRHENALFSDESITDEWLRDLAIKNDVVPQMHWQVNATQLVARIAKALHDLERTPWDLRSVSFLFDNKESELLFTEGGDRQAFLARLRPVDAVPAALFGWTDTDNVTHAGHLEQFSTPEEKEAELHRIADALGASARNSETTNNPLLVEDTESIHSLVARLVQRSGSNPDAKQTATNEETEALPVDAKVAKVATFLADVKKVLFQPTQQGIVKQSAEQGVTQHRQKGRSSIPLHAFKKMYNAGLRVKNKGIGQISVQQLQRVIDQFIEIYDGEALLQLVRQSNLMKETQARTNTSGKDGVGDTAQRTKAIEARRKDRKDEISEAILSMYSEPTTPANRGERVTIIRELLRNEIKDIRTAEITEQVESLGAKADQQVRFAALDLAFIEQLFGTMGWTLGNDILNLNHWQPDVKEGSEWIMRSAARSYRNGVDHAGVASGTLAEVEVHSRATIAMLEQDEDLMNNLFNAPSTAVRLQLLRDANYIENTKTPASFYTNINSMSSLEARITTRNRRKVDRETGEAVITANTTGVTTSVVPIHESSAASDKRFAGNIRNAEARPRMSEAATNAGHEVDAEDNTSTKYVYGSVNGKKTYKEQGAGVHSVSTMENTRAAEGKNLLQVTTSTTAPNGIVYEDTFLLDAIRLVEIGLAGIPGMDSHDGSQAGDIVQGLHAALSRMAAGPDWYGRELDFINPNGLNDSLVVIIRDGHPVTLGDIHQEIANKGTAKDEYYEKQTRQEIDEEIENQQRLLGDVYQRLVQRLKGTVGEARATAEAALSWVEKQIDYESTRKDAHLKPIGKENRFRKTIVKGKQDPYITARVEGEHIPYTDAVHDLLTHAAEPTRVREARERKELTAIDKMAPEARHITKRIIELRQNRRQALNEDVMGQESKPTERDMRNRNQDDGSYYALSGNITSIEESTGERKEEENLQLPRTDEVDTSAENDPLALGNTDEGKALYNAYGEAAAPNAQALSGEVDQRIEREQKTLAYQPKEDESGYLTDEELIEHLKVYLLDGDVMSIYREEGRYGVEKEISRMGWAIRKEASEEADAAQAASEPTPFEAHNYTGSSIGGERTAPAKHQRTPTQAVTVEGTGLKDHAALIHRIMFFVTNSLGHRLPLVFVAAKDVNASDLISAESKAKLNQSMQNNEMGAFLAQDSFGVVVLRDGLSQGEAIAVMSHEIGHAMYESMTSDYQQVLSNAYAEAMEQDVEAIDQAKMKEWVADQVAHYLASRDSKMLEDVSAPHTAPKNRKLKNAVLRRAIQRIAEALRRLWQKTTSELMQFGLDEDFSFYMDIVVANKKQAFTRSVDHNDVLNMSSAEVNRTLRSHSAKAKAKWKSGSNPIRKVFLAVYSQLGSISPKLSKMLYQKAQSAGPRAYAQVAEAIGGLNRGEIQRTIGALGKGAKQAFTDLRAGRDTEGARKLRNAIDRINALAQKHAPTMRFRDNFIPEAFNHSTIERDRSDFEAFLVEEGVFTKQEVTKAVDDILFSDGVTSYALAPGKPVSTHEHVDRILSLVDNQKLMEKEWLISEPEAILYHYGETLSKRAAWEHLFGGYTDQYKGKKADVRIKLLRAAGVNVDKIFSTAEAERLAKEIGLEKDGQFYSPNQKINEVFEEIREEQGEAAVERAKLLIDSAMGRLGNDLSPTLRSTFEWTTTFMNVTLLAFSGVASIPELASSVTRARGQLSMSDFKEVLADMGKAREFGMDIGTILTSGAEQMALETIGAQYRSPIVHKINQAFFKLNGQQFITRLSRTLATSTARQYLKRTAERAANGDTAAVKELEMLHTDAATINSWVEAGMPSDNIAAASAVTQFVYEASLKPSRFEATAWGNNPYFKLFWHLKQFFYTFGTVVVGGLMRQMHQRYQSALTNGDAKAAALIVASVPLIIAGAVFMPLAMLAEELRELIKGKDRTAKMSAGQYARLMLSKTGGLGPYEIVANMEQANDWGRSPIAALFPVAGFAETMLSSQVSTDKKLNRLVPFVSQGAFKWVYD